MRAKNDVSASGSQIRASHDRQTYSAENFIKVQTTRVYLLSMLKFGVRKDRSSMKVYFFIIVLLWYTQ